MTKLRLVLALSLTACGGLAAEPMTLDQAIKTALSQGPEAAVAAANLVVARASDAQAQARNGITATSSLGYQAAKGINDPASLPTAVNRLSSLSSPADQVMPQQATGSVTVSTPWTSATVSAGQTFQFNPDGTLLTSTTVSGSLNQTLLTNYPGGSLGSAADKSALTVQAAALTAAANANKAVLNVRNAYFTLLSAQDRLSMTTQTLAQRNDAFRFVQARASAGSATQYDLRVAQAAVRSAELDVAGANQSLTTARLRLLGLLGSSDTTVSAVAVDLDVPAASADEAVAAGLKNRAELATTALSARSAAIDAAAAAGAALPTVVLTAAVNYGAANSPLVAGKPSPTSSVTGVIGVKVTPPNLDGGQAQNQALQARTQQGVYQTQLEQLRRSIPVDVQDAWATWRLNADRLALARTNLDTADVNRQIVKSQFDAGAKQVADWLNAEVAYSTAQLSVVSAQLTLRQSAATLLNLMGL